MTEKNGRPTVMTDQTLQKLERAFIMGLSDREACLWANISPSTLYEYCKVHPDFSERKELLKEKPKMKAKVILSKALNKNDLETAQWYLERKASDEFRLKKQTELSGSVSVHNAFDKLTDEELRALIRDENG